MQIALWLRLRLIRSSFNLFLFCALQTQTAEQQNESQIAAKLPQDATCCQPNERPTNEAGAEQKQPPRLSRQQTQQIKRLSKDSPQTALIAQLWHATSQFAVAPQIVASFAVAQVWQLKRLYFFCQSLLALAFVARAERRTSAARPEQRRVCIDLWAPDSQTCRRNLRHSRTKRTPKQIKLTRRNSLATRFTICCSPLDLSQVCGGRRAISRFERPSSEDAPLASFELENKAKNFLTLKDFRFEFEQQFAVQTQSKQKTPQKQTRRTWKALSARQFQKQPIFLLHFSPLKASQTYLAGELIFAFNLCFSHTCHFARFY